MDHCRKISEHFSSSSVEETDLFLPSSRPRWLSSLYTDLTVTDCQDRKEAPPPTYLCIPIKTDVNCKYFNVETETKRVSWVCRVWSGNELISLSPDSDWIQPGSARQTARPRHDKISLSNICEELKWKYFDKNTISQIKDQTRPPDLAPATSLGILSEVVRVDVSGRHFQKVFSHYLNY